jgi:hypothetical protein
MKCAFTVAKWSSKLLIYLENKGKSSKAKEEATLIFLFPGVVPGKCRFTMLRVPIIKTPILSM